MVDVGTIPLKLTGGSGDDTPHLQKHHGKTPYRVPVQPDAGILPVSEPHFFIDILVRQIDTAGKSRVAVDHRDLPVITVVHDHVQHRPELIKGRAADPVTLKRPVILRRQCIDTPEIVVDQADLHAHCRLFLQHLQDRIPHISLGNNKVLHENIVFRLFQFLQILREPVLADRVIFRLCVGEQRRMGIFCKVAALPGDPGILLLQSIDLGILFLYDTLIFNQNFVVGYPELMRQPGMSEYRIQNDANDREHQDTECPHQLISRIQILAYQPQYGNDRYKGQQVSHVD